MDDAKGAAKLIAAKTDAMTRKQAFSIETQVWKADGSRATDVTVPRFEGRPRSAGSSY